LQKNLDQIVKQFIEEEFEGRYIKADKQNYITRDKQYKASDYFLIDREICLELKSRTPSEEYSLMKRLHVISKSQNAPFRTYGLVNTGQIIQGLPNSADANKKLTDYAFSKMFRHIRDAAHKFKQEHIYANRNDPTNIVIFSDHSLYLETTDTAEYYLGTNITREDIHKNHLHCIIYIKRPDLVIDVKDSYWIKVLIRDEISEQHKRRSDRFARELHVALAQSLYATPYWRDSRNCCFRSLYC
jgi:hypothetical protein